MPIIPRITLNDTFYQQGNRLLPANRKIIDPRKDLPGIKCYRKWVGIIL